MAQYAGPFDPEDAARAFGGLPGNYILFDRWGRAYPGRQGFDVNRIAAHLRDYPGEYVQAYFMINHTDDRCVRADREQAAVVELLSRGFTIRNKRWPATPAECIVEDW